jgi:hypothetical protein
MSLPSYLGLKSAPIWMVLVGSSALIYAALASLAALKVPYEEGMAGLVEEGSALRHISLSSVTATAVAANSLLFSSSSNAR